MKKFACVLILLVALTAQAQEKKKGLVGGVADNGESAYGMAGCGLGSILFGESDKRLFQIFASTTNGLYSNNTFAMSSGTSNCNAEKAERTTDIKKNIDVFVAANREALATDLAKNNGETIVALAHIVGCPDSKVMGAELKKSYSTIFTSLEESTVSDNLYNNIVSNNYIGSNCRI